MASRTPGQGAGPNDRAVREALRQVLGSRPIERITPVFGGASGARLLRVEAGALRLLARAEGPETPLLKRNPHRFLAMHRAAEAGVAPRVHYLDEASGVTITDFIDQQPIGAFPGGPVGLARALGELFAKLQADAVFPPLVDYRALVSDMLDHLAASGLFAEGLLEPHAAALARLRAEIAWNPDRLAASHNDPNPNNILFDGTRLWLVDWEAGYANDPLVDLAIVSDAFGDTDELAEALLSGWLGRPPDPALRERLAAVRRLTRLYYACFLLHAGAAAQDAPVRDLALLTSAEMLARLRDGRLGRGAPQTAFEFGKVYLEAFRTGVAARGMREAAAAAF